MVDNRVKCVILIIVLDGERTSIRFFPIKEVAFKYTFYVLELIVCNVFYLYLELTTG